MVSTGTEGALKQKYKRVGPALNEKGRRYWAASEAMALGHGGIAAVSRITGLSEMTIRRGCAEIEQGSHGDHSATPERERRAGGGRKTITEHHPQLCKALERLVEPNTRGDPMSPLRWTSKSTARLASELTKQGHPCSARTVATLLGRDLGYSLQAIQKKREGKQHPDRDAQFRYINRRVKTFLNAGDPVLSIDSKKKEKVGDFSKAGREYHPKKSPETSSAYDFGGERAIPYGLYDMRRNTGWVNVGTDHETAQFAVESIRRWWRYVGQQAYPQARSLLLVADGGGGNGSRVRLWKYELQKLANELELSISVSHFPPGTSKWNKIEHRMWNHVTKNSRGRKLTSHAVVLNLIANTTTKSGLRIKAKLDKRAYPTGVKVTDKQMSEIHLVPEKFHGKDWNYSIKPN
jgi:hypothetical protein